MPNPGPAVERHPQKDQIIDWMLTGVNCNAISKRITPSISRVALERYRQRRIVPAIENAQFIRKGKSLQGLPTETLRNILANYQQKSETAEVTKGVLQADPLLARYLERADLQRDLLHDSAKAKDFKGFSAVNMAATRDDELHARLTGRLDHQASGGNMVVLMPGAHLSIAPAAPQRQERPVIDVRGIDVQPAIDVPADDDNL